VAASRPGLWLAAALLVVAALVWTLRARHIADEGNRDASTGRAAGTGDGMREGEVLTVDVLALNFDPVIPQAGNLALHEAMKWRNPGELASGYAGDVERASGGFVRYRIVEWRDVPQFHPKADGFVYAADDYVGRYRTGRGWHEPDAADYRRTFREHGILPRVSSGEIDEVWFFGGPYFGYSEGAMAGPGAFGINGSVFEDVPVDRAFAIMGFNYERGVAEMLENLCHRVEATMSRVYGGWRVDVLDHAWARFAANEAQSGVAAAGSCHWPPNATAEYDFANPRTVVSTAGDWLSYPHLTGRAEPLSRSGWGGPDYARNYFRWWLSHLPKAAGVQGDGRANNWWKYVFDFGRYDESGRTLEPAARGAPAGTGGQN
jgi:hypothetical protein